MIPYHPVVQTISFAGSNSLDILRLDLLHPEISGNKWFKLKKNLEAATLQNKTTILTFGGAFSNHIAATAAACKLLGFKSVGVIRGAAPLPLNRTLLEAQQNGMELFFMSREEYARKHEPLVIKDLLARFKNPYLIPEGGNNKEGVVGCMEILKPEWHYDYVFCACGTATTYMGLLASVKSSTKVIGINVLKGLNGLVEEVNTVLPFMFPDWNTRIGGNEVLNLPTIESSCITSNYCFNGYAKFDQELVDFKNKFEQEHTIPLDYIYTTKLVYAVSDLIKQKKLKHGFRALMVHSGGLQGNAGFEERYKIHPH